MNGWTTFLKIRSSGLTNLEDAKPEIKQNGFKAVEDLWSGSYLKFIKLPSFTVVIHKVFHTSTPS